MEDFGGSHGFRGGGERRGRSVVANRVYHGDFRKLTANLLPLKKGGVRNGKKRGRSITVSQNTMGRLG